MQMVLGVLWQSYKTLLDVLFFLKEFAIGILLPDDPLSMDLTLSLTLPFYRLIWTDIIKV